MITNHENMAGRNHCIIWFICRCCSDCVACVARLLEMRCWSHMEANTSTSRMMSPLLPRSSHRNVRLSGTASWMNSTSYRRPESPSTASGVLPRVMRMTW